MSDSYLLTESGTKLWVFSFNVKLSKSMMCLRIQRSIENGFDAGTCAFLLIPR